MKIIRQDPRWPDAHVTLRRVYEERVPRGMSQAEFGATYGLGVQGMVWQYLNGYTPLNYDAAAKFARGLRCTIRDISPAMAASLEADILPVLGRMARKVAALAFLAISLAHPPPAEATLHKPFYVNDLTVIRIACRLARRQLGGVIVALQRFARALATLLAPSQGPLSA
jgi:transcriptional regulator with XRE-family HTH domain